MTQQYMCVILLTILCNFMKNIYARSQNIAILELVRYIRFCFREQGIGNGEHQGVPHKSENRYSTVRRKSDSKTT